MLCRAPLSLFRVFTWSPQSCGLDTCRRHVSTLVTSAHVHSRGGSPTSGSLTSESSVQFSANPSSLPVFLLLNQPGRHLSQMGVFQQEPPQQSGSFSGLAIPVPWPKDRDACTQAASGETGKEPWGEDAARLHGHYPKFTLINVCFSFMHKHFSVCYVPLARFLSANKIVGFEHFVLLYSCFLASRFVSLPTPSREKANLYGGFFMLDDDRTI